MSETGVADKEKKKISGEDVLQEEINRLNEEKSRLLKQRDLEEKRQELLEEKESLKDDIEDAKRGIKPIQKDNSIIWNILLLIVLILLAGGIITEGREMARYGIFLLIPVGILILKILDRFKSK